MAKLNRRESERNRKAKAAVINRWLGWLTFICMAAPPVTQMLQNRNGTAFPGWITAVLPTLFWLLIFVHAFISVYTYGLPEYKKHLRVIDMYIGFSVFAFLLLNRSFVFVEQLKDITSALVWLPVALHILFGIRFLLQRVLKKEWDTPLTYYIGGNAIRDATK